MIKPFVLKGLSIASSLRILNTVVLPKACYLAHLWDFNDKISIHSILKDILRAPFNPPSELLHVVAQVPPMKLRHTQLRLTTLKQLILSNNFQIQDNPKSKLTLSLKTEVAKLLGIRTVTENTQIATTRLSRSQILNYITKLWKRIWNLTCICSGPTDNLLCKMGNPDALLTHNKVPLDRNPKITGSLCALLSGHSRLQAHLYRLGQTFSPTCICLGGDETPSHYVLSVVYSTPLENVTLTY